MKQQSGFSLIELMVVVAIIAILVTIGYPLYTEQAKKGRRVEGRDALLAIAQAEERAYTVNGAYNMSIPNLSVSGVVSCDNNGNCFSEDRNYYAVTVSGTASSFTATATARGGQASDTDCTSMSINQLGQKTGTGNDTAKCW